MRCRVIFRVTFWPILVLLIPGVGGMFRAVLAAPVDDLQQLIARGEFTEAEKRLQPQIAEPLAPVTSEAAIQLEILRRTRQDFALNSDDVLKQLKESVPDATQVDVDRWREAGDLQFRIIDGQTRYFQRAVSNLFRFNAESKRRQVNARPEKKFDTTALVEKLVRMAESAESPEVYPVKHNVRYELTVRENHPRVKPGAIVRAWLPFPQEYRNQQRDVKLVRSEPPHEMISDTVSPQRTIYFEQKIGSGDERPRFFVGV